MDIQYKNGQETTQKNEHLQTSLTRPINQSINQSIKPLTENDQWLT